MSMFLVAPVFAGGLQTVTSKGNALVTYSVLVGSNGVIQGDQQFGFPMGNVIASTTSWGNRGIATLPIISSTTYTGILDWNIEPISGGYDIYWSTMSNFNASGYRCNLIKAGEKKAIGGRNNTAIYGKTLNATGNLTTVYIILNIDEVK
jgi:hypothetical protein